MAKKLKNKTSFGICAFKDGKLIDTMLISRYEWKCAIMEVYKLKCPVERKRRKEIEDTFAYWDKVYYEVKPNSSHD